MKKRIVSMMLAVTLMLTSAVNVFATEMTESTENTEEIISVHEENPEEDSELIVDSSEESNASEVLSNETTEEMSESEEAENPAGEEAATEEPTEKSTEEPTEEVVEEAGDEVEITENDRPYLALGADLTEEQKSIVLSLMGIDADRLADYDVTYTTNAEEHQYLGTYVDASKIGTRSLSSVLIVQREEGSGLNITTKNINYCTIGMYKNALTTAGVTDADIIIVGPTQLSGTAALVGIFKAYQDMTGEEIDENIIDAALNELVITGELASILDQFTNEEIEEFIAYIKAVVAERELKDADDINKVIDEACEKYGVTLTDEYRQQIVDLLLKITSLGIDLSGLIDYAESLYNSYKNGGDSNSGIIATVVNAISNFFASIADFFKNLFK